MNKKAVSQIVTTILIILLVLAAIVIIKCVIFGCPDEPHFKITKEECRKITLLGIIKCFGDEGVSLEDNEYKLVFDLNNAPNIMEYIKETNHTNFSIFKNSGKMRLGWNGLIQETGVSIEVCATEYFNRSKCEQVEVSEEELIESLEDCGWKFKEGFKVDIPFLDEQCEILEMDCLEREGKPNICKTPTKYLCPRYYEELNKDCYYVEK